MDINKIVVIGTGVMGPGIALQAAWAGYDVAIIGRSTASVENGMSSLVNATNELTDHGILTMEEKSEIISRITPTTSLREGVENADYVIESVIEDLEVKQALFARLDEICPAHTVLATNTSGLSPTEIAARMKRPERVVATHFWNPPHLVPLVEVGRGNETSRDTVEVSYKLMESLGKQPVIVQKDILGFIGNRLQHAMFREALSLVEKGVITPQDIDKVVLNSFGPRYSVIGVMEYMDMTGADLNKSVHSYLLRDLDNSESSFTIEHEMVRNGELGMKTGKGFYDWKRRDPHEALQRRNRPFIERLKLKKE